MHEPSQGDRYLLELIRQGRPEGWTALVDRYHGRLLAFARRRMRRDADAEDLVQDTFIRFLKAVANFREESSLETYLFTILRRLMIDYSRGRQANVCLLQDVLQQDSRQPGPDLMPAPDPTASTYARRAEDHTLQRGALTAALIDLVDHYKSSANFRDLQVIEMIFYCQLRNRDAAQIAGLAENHIALLKHRCMNRIKEQIARQGQPTQADPPDDLLSEIWQELRLSCPKRSTLGAYLLGTLDPDWHDYVAFHLDRLGCQFCQSNLDDLREQTTDHHQTDLRQRILQSTVGFLRSP